MVASVKVSRSSHISGPEPEKPEKSREVISFEIAICMRKCLQYRYGNP